MPLLNKLFGKKPEAAASKGGEPRPATAGREIKKPEALILDKKIKSNILISPFTTEKALSGEKLSQYIFKVLSSANKIDIAKEVRRTYNVRAVSVRIINVSKKARRVGRTLGFKSGYKKAMVTLAKGQTIELK